jgi:hypothetical protein
VYVNGFSFVYVDEFAGTLNTLGGGTLGDGVKMYICRGVVALFLEGFVCTCMYGTYKF